MYVLPGHEHEVQEFDCDRELALVDGQWVVRPFEAGPLTQHLVIQDSVMQNSSVGVRPANANSARNVVVVGTQWGDEGKGKVVDWLTDHAAAVVRFKVVTTPGIPWSSMAKKTALQLIPSGIMRDGVVCYIGNGVVVDPTHLLSEIERPEAAGLNVRSRLYISESCL